MPPSATMNGIGNAQPGPNTFTESAVAPPRAVAVRTAGRSSLLHLEQKLRHRLLGQLGYVFGHNHCNNFHLSWDTTLTTMVISCYISNYKWNCTPQPGKKINKTRHGSITCV